MTGLAGTVGPPLAVVARTEQRMARMIGYERAACAAFVLIPLFGWARLRYPWIAAGAAAGAIAEAAWFVWRVWPGSDRLSRRLVFADVAFCVVLMLVGSRAAEPHARNKIMTELVPFSLVSPAGVGFALGLGFAGVAAVVVLMAAWSLAVLPDVTLKLCSDLLGFALWYVVALLIARELRDLSQRTARAQEAAEAASRLAIAQEREAERLHQRDYTHREIHDYLLPIVDHVAGGGTPSAALVREARRGAQRARRLITDPRAPSEGLEAMMSAVVDGFVDEGLPLVPFLAVSDEPPEPVREALVAATREALRNVVRHAGPVAEVSLFVEGGADAVLVVVRDRGVGFDPATVRAGGGLAGSYPALLRHGGRVDVTARPGGGVRVALRWPAPPEEASA